MIRILLIALLAATPAYAKSKNPNKNANVRVAEAFQALPRKKVVQPSSAYDDEDWKPPPKPGIWLKPPPPYMADRPSYNVNGKSRIYRECEVEIKQDPGEHTCHMVWGWI